jgi:hypothetical protein
MALEALKLTCFVLGIVKSGAIYTWRLLKVMALEALK